MSLTAPLLATRNAHRVKRLAYFLIYRRLTLLQLTTDDGCRQWRESGTHGSKSGREPGAWVHLADQRDAIAGDGARTPQSPAQGVIPGQVGLVLFDIVLTGLFGRPGFVFVGTAKHCT